MATILVIDDDAFLRQLATGLLRRSGHVVVQAASAGEGQARLAESLPDLVLLDVELPDRSGLDLLDDLKAGLTCPVVLMSGNGSPSDRDAALARGAVDYIVKPFPPGDLAARVAAALPGAAE
ncbi:MAG: two-component system, OmpR family, response regulator [Actinomycetota bacterium]|jgi:DNA-binding response OmpR family regulator|nr:two-component system, OmpR family, response regulator [Actinomycetota bacterium]